MDLAAEDAQKNIQQDTLTTIANVSRLLRQAIANNLQVAPEQYLTVAIPGTVVDLTDAEKGGSYVYNVSEHAFPPLAVRQAEAALVDGMMPLANVMLGNTGKSVARSYSRALDGIVPRKANLGEEGLRSPGVPSYDAAMIWLTTKDPFTNLTPVDIYTQKQKAWGEAQAEWQAAKITAQRMAEAKYPASAGTGGSSDDYIGKQVQEYNEWNQQNYQRYKTAVQAKWIDWVTNGQKYNVEYYFGMVDTDSIMARVEASKESMRNSSLVDADGANEVFGVSLTPKQWATLCKRKAEGWWTTNGEYSLAQLNAEISRLEQLQETYGQLQIYVDAEPANREYPAKNPVPPTSSLAEAKAAVTQAIKKLYDAQGVLNGLRHSSTKPTDEQVQAVATAEAELKTAQLKYADVSNQWAEYNVAALQGDVKGSVKTWVTSSIGTVSKQLEALRALRTEKSKNMPVTLDVIEDYNKPNPDNPNAGEGIVVAAPGSEFAHARFGIDKDGNIIPPAPVGGMQNAEDANPWTSISFSYSAVDQKKSAEESTWGFSAGGSVGWGLWSAGGAYSHDETHASMQEDMASCDVSISFSALVVNINRPWLYGEIFNDFELDVAAQVNLSPGPAELQNIIKTQNLNKISTYGEFPAYPTSMVVAADTTIEFKGSTSHIESTFNSHSNSGSFSFGYGPWSASSSFHESGSKSAVQMHTTATGCKITFGAPQVIAWVSQILPALPRKEKYNPLGQGAGQPLPDPIFPDRLSAGEAASRRMSKLTNGSSTS